MTEKPFHLVPMDNLLMKSLLLADPFAYPASISPASPCFKVGVCGLRRIFTLQHVKGENTYENLRNLE